MARRKFMGNLLAARRGMESKAIPMGGYSTGHYSAGTAPVFITQGIGGGTRYGGVDRAAGWDMDAVITEGYERDIWVYRCVELISGSSSRLPFRAAFNRGEDDERVIEDHPLYRVLNGKANPLETGRAFRKRLSAQVLLSKRGAFIEVTRSRMGTITRLDLLDPSRVRPIPSMNGDYLDYFEFVRQDGLVREIAPERVRWVREPHPLDPFCGTTPLEAAGISINLDTLARSYNVAFIRNDGRPGGIVGVDTDTLRDDEADRIERKFQPGVHTAGEIAVIATGQGGLRYVDTTTRPRDMAYGEMSGIVKNEILAAFGVGESLLGNASGRTFDNADAEEYNFWTKPMPPHNELVTGVFAEDLPEGAEGFLDTSKIEALELAERKRREEARQEWNAGLRSADEYRVLAKLPPLNNPQSRALWFSPAKAPVPANEADAAVLLGGGMPGEDPAAIEGGEGAAGELEGTAADAVAEARELEGGEAAGALGAAAAAVTEAREAGAGGALPGGPSGDAAAALAEARQAPGRIPSQRSAAEAVDQARLEGKALSTTSGDDVGAADESTAEYETSEAAIAAAEAALGAALAGLMERQEGVIGARLQSPKLRKGTRFWKPDSDSDTRGGAAAVDATKVVDVDQFVTEALETLTPLLQEAAIASGRELLDVLNGHGVLLGALTAAELSALAAQVTRQTSMGLVAQALAAMTDWLQSVLDVVNAEAAAAGSMEQVIAAVHDFYASRGAVLARGLGTDLAVGAVNGGADAAAASLAPSPQTQTTVVRSWITRQDSRVRPAHAAVHADSREVGDRFLVGGESLLYPQDPVASPANRYGCRCRLSYRTAMSGRFLPPPLT